MKAIKDIIITPHFTEKTTHGRMLHNQYAFKVALDANKIEIKKAIENRFQVKVENVTTARTKGKLKRTRGQHAGFRSDWKKAYVRLREGDAIQEFEGA